MNTIVNHYVWAADSLQPFEFKIPAAARLINVRRCLRTHVGRRYTTSGDGHCLTFIEDSSHPRVTRSFAIHYGGAAIPHGESFHLAFDDNGEPAYVFEVV